MPTLLSYRPGRPLRHLLAALALPLALAACGGDDDDDNDRSAATPATPSPYLDAKAGDFLQVPLSALHPTQAAIGYDQIYYKLGRWQPDDARPTWAANPTQQLVYLNRTLGKKFDDYCEDTGRGERAQAFQSLEEARAARLDDPDSFTCRDEPGANPDAMKTVVVGPAGTLYLTDGHHGFSSLYEVADGGPSLPVWVRVDANYSDVASQDAFWQRMIDARKTWLRDADNQPITPDALPTRVGLAHPDSPGGLAEDPYRSLVYYTRNIAYLNGGLPEFAEFYWADWLRADIQAGNLAPLTSYHLKAPSTPDQILAVSTLNGSLAPRGDNASYAALVRDATLRMQTLGDADPVSGELTAADLGRLTLVPNAPNPSPTKDARDELEELVRNDVNSSGNSRGAGKLWFAVNYRACGAPATGTCWGW